ncbi:MAG: ABC transporter permease [bacterium]|nr:ABC transporter permease [bacterium]
MMTKKPRTIPASRFFPLLIIFILWELGAYFSLFSPEVFPPPSRVLKTALELLVRGLPPGHGLHLHAVYSLLRVSLGFVIALALALPLGFLAGWSPGFHRALNPIVNLIRPIPPLAWIPVAVIWFGIGLKSSSFLIALGIFFPVLLNTISGVRGVNPVYLDAARTLGAGEFSLITKVLIPAALPMVLTGVRVGLGVGWMTLVAAELTGVRSGYGLGFMIMTARDLGRVDAILAGMAAIGLIGYLMDRTILFLERKTSTAS